MKLFNFILGCTGVFAFFLLFGVVGALDNDSIEIGQAIIKATCCLGYMLFAISVHKNAPKVLEHLKRATRKTIIFILRNIRGKVNEQF